MIDEIDNQSLFISEEFIASGTRLRVGKWLLNLPTVWVPSFDTNMNNKLIDIQERLVKAYAKVTTTINTFYHYKVHLPSTIRGYKDTVGKEFSVPAGTYHIVYLSVLAMIPP